ncbi:MAG: ATP-binding cassette domain-containing protein [Polyangiaceae bacterium]
MTRRGKLLGRRAWIGLGLVALVGALGLLGQSGSGKTTLLRILARLDSFSAGIVSVSSPCTMVFQEPRLVESKRVLANVLWGVEADDDARERGERALSEVGLAHLAGAWLSASVSWPRPRARSGPEFESLRSQLLAAPRFDAASAPGPAQRSSP